MTEPERIGPHMALKQAVQRVVNEYADVLGGVGLVGDVCVVLESHQSDGNVVLRFFDSDVPSWRQLGMLTSAIQTVQAYEVADAVRGLGGYGESMT